jgi:hypothetical protein
MLLPYLKSSDTATLSNRINVLKDTTTELRTDINAHITEDGDLDSLNERIDSISFRNDTLNVYEHNNTQTVFVETFIKAVGKVNSDGTAAKIKGATVSRISKGYYQVTFTEARPTANYVIQISVVDLAGAGNDNPAAAYLNQTTNGFRVKTGDNDNGASDRNLRDMEFMFTVIDF